MNEIKKRRKALGYTQSQLADLVGCTRQHLCNVENGKCYNISLTLALELCYVFDCKLCDLFKKEFFIASYVISKNNERGKNNG